ncbi:hypothetical protein GCM10022297_01120 [Lactobacillus hamsteri]|uniref:Uncharacterized protein n=1 Tax=Lactobacillus hamsteri DSM 5661 = JCM 6256 TaxID=1423754 RepID=A0A0R1Y496_9LACO|nr:hypothetical protein [Lactobacillus hamsteri]KRM37002.1 hypothetical protein FC39_GL000454 [Lactobacillus hamsteri DSM 5661 = JCM 6256]
MREVRNKTSNKEPKFTKVGLMAGNFTTTEKDIMNIVLKDGKEYTIPEAKKAIEEFKKGF